MYFTLPFRQATMNIISRMCYSKGFTDSNDPEFVQFIQAASTYFELVFDPTDWLPWTSILPNKNVKKLTEQAIIRDRIIKKWIDEARVKKQPTSK
jgi:hypothetical protein